MTRRRVGTIALVTGVWLLYGIVLAAWFRVHMPDYHPGYDWDTAFHWAAPDAALWALLCVVPIQLAMRLPLRRPHALRNAALHVGAAALVVVVHRSLDAYLGFLQGGYPGQDFTEVVGLRLKESFLLNFLLYGIIVVIVHLVDHNRRLQAERQRTAELDAALSEARLRALQMQIRPHFLLNALHTINGLIDEDVAAAKRTIRHLGDILRTMVSVDPRQEVSLLEELDLIGAYLAIERVRFQDRLQVTLDVPDDCRDASVPSLLLQPLVENALRHGIAPQPEGGRVTVRARRVDGRLEIEVRDDGRGFVPDATRPNGTGIGIPNVRRRLQILYGPEHAFHIESPRAGGVRVAITLPFRPAPHVETTLQRTPA